jgi:hypothetical protein
MGSESIVSASENGPIRLVRHFLDAMEARDLARARSYLADGFTMTFPGGERFTELEALVAWARPRYRFVRKSYERFDAGEGSQGRTVTCFGTLSGEWPDGRSFEGIRFCDWFLVRDDRLQRQEVWNDLALHVQGAS